MEYQSDSARFVSVMRSLNLRTGESPLLTLNVSASELSRSKPDCTITAGQQVSLTPIPSAELLTRHGRTHGNYNAFAIPIH